jgi:voltage-gated sodium channel
MMLRTSAKLEHAFNQVATAVIVVNGLVVVAGLFDTGLELLINLAENGCLTFFLVELGLRLWQAGWATFRSPWLWFDIAVMALALLPVGSGVLALRLARLARTATAVHLVRHGATHLGHLMPHWRGSAGRRSKSKRRCSRRACFGVGAPR